MRTLTVVIAIAAGLIAGPVIAADAAAPDAVAEAKVGELIVTGRSETLVGVASSASEGRVGAVDLALRPILRPGEIVEAIPGVIITQHSGSGKANQYFLRGFNLDHGTDLSVSLDDVPVNMPSHAHGQGYADLNFLIPELVKDVTYEKGPYHAEVGDFGSAGAFAIHYDDRLPDGVLKIEGGQTGYARGLLADSVDVASGRLLYALELEHNDGPWVKGDDERKIDAVLRFSRGDGSNGWAVTAMAYHNRWNATDQIPDRAIAGRPDPVDAPRPPAADLISAWGEIDPSDGGDTSRYSLSADWRRTDGDSRARLHLYGLYYDLDLFSNFTYFLDDPIRGDQIEQEDRRSVFGGEASQSWSQRLAGLRSETTIGLQVRRDDIRNGLYHTQARVRLAPTSVNQVDETSLAPYAENQIHWLPWLRTIVGLREDAVWMGVRNVVGGDSGRVSARQFSPKINIILGPWAKTEIYVDYGEGFHSNDARGVVAKVDSATPLARSRGEEIGLRTTLIPNLRTELSLWRLDLQSELVWDGDAGANTPSGPTRRYGVEFANWYNPTRWLTLDADYAWSHARFTDHEPDGPYVPEALASTFDGGLAVHDLAGWAAPWSAGLRLRDFGPRTLTQDNRIRSKATTLLYADLGYRVSRRLSLGVTVFNLLDAHDSDIDYVYVSRLPGEPLAGVNDIHTHPAEPREVRGVLTALF